MNLEAQCKARVEEAFKTAEKHYKRKFERCPVVFSSGMTKTGGTARTMRNGSPVLITLSSKLLHINKEVFVARTPGHEAAHIIANQLVKGGAGHGPVWKQVMHVIGQEAERTHNMDTPKTGFEFSCACKVHNVSKIVANRIMRGAEYKCKLCKSVLAKGKTPAVSVKAPVVRKAPVKAKVATKAIKTVTGTSKSAVVRNIVIANPKLSVDQLVAIVIAQLGMKASLARVYVQGHVDKVRG